MARKKIYSSEDSENPVELDICKNTNGDLFINLSPFPSHSSDVYITLPREDAEEIIQDLAYSFDFILLRKPTVVKINNINDMKTTSSF
jgi:hypothetical protein